jgi:hypothetical protein
MFPTENGLKKENALSQLVFNTAQVYATSRVQVNQDGFKLDGTYQLQVSAGNIDMLGGSAII